MHLPCCLALAGSAGKKAALELIVAPAIKKRILVKRNRDRFPEDFMFQLDKAEAAVLRSQIATSNEGRGGRRYAPYVFTEQGVAMLSGVLRSKRAGAVNIEIMRAFVELRRAASNYAALETRLDELEREMGRHDEQLSEIFGALRQLISPPVRPKRPVGFRPPEDNAD